MSDSKTSSLFTSQVAHQSRSLSRFLWHEATRSIIIIIIIIIFTHLYLDGMPVHRRVTPSISPVPIYTPGWREAPWE